MTTNKDRIRCFKCREYDHFLRIVQLGKLVGKQNRYNKCPIGQRSNTITNPTDRHRSRQTDHYPSRDQRQFRLIQGKDDPTAFLPLGPKLGGNSKKSEVNKNVSIDKNCLTSRQADYIYKRIELGSSINKSTMKEEIDSDVELDRMDGNSGDKNPYRELIVNNAGKIESMLSQMEQWSILSNIINYVQYSKIP